MVVPNFFVLFAPSCVAAPLMPCWRPPEGPRANPEGGVRMGLGSMITGAVFRQALDGKVGG